MSSGIPSVPHISPPSHHLYNRYPSPVESHSFGSSEFGKPIDPSTSTRAPYNTRPTSSKPLTGSPVLKTPIPAKSPYRASAMTSGETPIPTPIASEASSITTSQNEGIFGWGVPAEAAFFISLAVLGICLPLGLCFFLKRRRRQSRKTLDESSTAQINESIDMDGTLRGSTTRPPTASSWLEMLKHRTEIPAPPHTSEDGKEDIYYEPPKPVIFARRKFCTRLSGRMSEADIEREVRELDEEVRRRSKMTRSRGQSVGILPDLEDSCSGCASSYTRDERGHTQPVEGRRGTPIPFLPGAAELDGSTTAAAVVKRGEEDKSLVIETIRVVDDRV
ncbi:hypothetical protein H072_3155 [Dactylellina haptotyla CBS 200.50]|uniref:Uncharacterized protein n=1 Tax=Dactylellina haptotyla (strain CBS 200.50) TaxID=1284197 RepID=S8AIT3_DACHA|nr:hypothetical protein H072_3155 [Dactylellina haptotyla CBS 200.50]